ncbi:MAG: VanZ family protein [Alicyclobacillus sp.]|nr:VanZ family protein [Alicyclobacillus sp.]
MLTFTSFAAIGVIVYAILAIRFGAKNNIPKRNAFLYSVFFVYLLVIVKITLFPIPHPILGGSHTLQTNLIPFRTIRSTLAMGSVFHDFYDLGGNILLFVPFGFLLPLIFKNQNRLVSVVFLGFCATLTVESAQFMISYVIGYSYRHFDVDDLILNTLGTMMGYAAFRVLVRLQHSRAWKTRRAWITASATLVLMAVVGVWGYEFTSHSTPIRALESYDSNVLPIETVSLGSGVVLITPTDPSKSPEPGYVAWYMDKSRLLGWRLKSKVEAPLTTDTKYRGVSFASMAMRGGQTFVFGTKGETGEKAIVYKYKNRTYTSTMQPNLAVWYMIIPSHVGRVSADRLALLYSNGTTTSLSGTEKH